MTQNEFFNILMDCLKDFPETKLQDIISYYENKFALGLASGKTEEEITNELDNPNLIAKKYRNEDSNTPINSEQLIDDNIAASINNKNSSNDSNFNTHINLNKAADTFMEDQNTFTDNKYNDIYSEFKINNNFNNTCDDKKDDLNIAANTNDFNNLNSNDKPPQYSVNTILKFCIVGLALIIFSPIITGIIGCILGLFGVAISILFGSIGILVGGTFTSFIGLPNVPMFVANFPYPVIVLFSLGSISLSILLMLLFYYLCKFFIQISIKAYKSLKSKGGAF